MNTWFQVRKLQTLSNRNKTSHPPTPPHRPAPLPLSLSLSLSPLNKRHVHIRRGFESVLPRDNGTEGKFKSIISMKTLFTLQSSGVKTKVQTMLRETLRLRKWVNTLNLLECCKWTGEVFWISRDFVCKKIVGNLRVTDFITDHISSVSYLWFAYLFTDRPKGRSMLYCTKVF